MKAVPMNYHDLLNEVELIKLRKDRDGIRLVGDGLIVSIVEARVDEWEAKFRQCNAVVVIVATRSDSHPVSFPVK